MGLPRGGSHASNTSGEQLLAFSTANRVPRDGKPVRAVRRRRRSSRGNDPLGDLPGDGGGDRGGRVNSLLAARSMTGRDGNTLYALPVDRTLELLDGAGRLVR